MRCHKENCELLYYYNKTDIKPTALDGRFQIILANWPNYRKIMCLHNNNIPINIPGHPYILMNRSILCNCDVEAKSNFLLESLAACEGSETKTDLEMYFTIKLAFVNYFNNTIEEIGIPILRKWTTQEKISLLSTETFVISPTLLNAPETLQDLAIQYQNKRNNLDKKEQELENPKEISKFKSFLNSFLANIPLFTVAPVTMIITVIICNMYGQSKLKALVANIVMLCLKGVEATDISGTLCTCKAQWYIMGMLIIITLGMLYLVTNKITRFSIHNCIQETHTY